MPDKEYVIRKSNTKNGPKKACYDIIVTKGNVHMGFTYTIPKDPIEGLVVKTWEDQKAYFLGIVTPPVDGSVYLINCKCVLERFKSRTFWDDDWLSEKSEWYTCWREKCASACCEECFDKNRVKKISGSYSCPFPCKTNITHNVFNDMKKKMRDKEAIENDTRACAECGMTRLLYKQLHPLYKHPMSFTSLPDGSGKSWCNRCRVFIMGLGRKSLTNRKRKLSYKRGINKITQEEYEAELKILEEEEKNQPANQRKKRSVEDNDSGTPKKKRTKKGKREILREISPILARNSDGNSSSSTSDGE